MLTVTDLGPLPARIRDRIRFDGGLPTEGHTPTRGECWTYSGFHSNAGYPYATAYGKYQPAHRAVWFYLTGDRLPGLDLDHLCRNPACVNPAHMEPVTHAENQARIALAHTACRKAGHDWSDPNNVRIRPSGRRYCAECDRIALRKRYQPTGRPQNGTQSHCKHGHPFSGENVYLYVNPTTGRSQRRCRACIRNRNRKV